FFTKHLPAGIRYLLSWLWVKQFLYWLFVSAGTVSECAFLVASIWMSVNSSVHPMILHMMTEDQSVNLSYVASTIFTAIPEMILGLALLKTIEHCKNIRYKKEHWYTCVWPVLFGLPTLVFLFISVLTVACSVLKVNYVMPDWGIVARALSGYLFVIVSFLYERIGEPCYASERKGLEANIADLNQQIENLKASFAQQLLQITQQTKVTLDEKQTEIERFQNLLKSQNDQVLKLAEKASSLELRGLENYPKVISEWIDRGVKTVSIEEAIAITGHSKRRISNAKSLQRHSRNKDLIMVSSLVEWLKTAPLPETPISASISHNGHSKTSEQNTDSLVPLTV